jgi:phosphatidylserine/phosphatidylglycerophosphate/cardiolipin synthase-like enzyme
LNQNRWLAPDPFRAIVNFNYSKYDVYAQPNNVYHLGYFKQHEASHALSSHHLSFIATNSFHIRFETNRLLMMNIPIEEWLFEVRENPESISDEYLIITRKVEPIVIDRLEFDKDSHITRTITINCATCSYQLKFSIIRSTISSKSVAASRHLKIDSNTRNAVQSQRQYEESLTQDYLEKQKMIETINTKMFTSISSDNQVEILIDGLQTFGRYYHYMMQAQESIDILAWELSLSFGLVFAKKDSNIYKQFLDPNSGDPIYMKFSKPRNVSNGLKYNDYLKFLNRMFSTSFPQLTSAGRWITLQDVLLTKAAAGVKIRLMVWRHKLLSYLTKFVYLGEVTIEREAQKLKKKAARMGLKVKILHTDFNLPNPSSPYADPYFENWKSSNANIVLIIVGNPKGMVSCHHEKLLLIDAEKPNRCVAFTGGYDIARGRYDQPLHLPPISTWTWSSIIKASMKRSDDKGTFEHEAIQPFLRNIRLLWHDNQIMIKGSATRIFHLHFVQRWIHAFTGNNHRVRELALPEFKGGEPMQDPPNAAIHKNVVLRVLRSWPGVFATHTLVDNFCNLIRSAQDFIYVEHQYPFHNVSLTQCLCEALQNNKNLKIILIVPVRTDLPTGIVGQYFDASQDQIDEHLRLIYSIASTRVGVYGLVVQDPKSKIIKSIYVHSKLMIVDGKVMATGSANMDTLSFYRSSEFHINLFNEAISKETLERLAREHLEDYYTDEMRNNFELVFNAFKNAGDLNYKTLLERGTLSGRIFPVVPKECHTLITAIVNYPSPISKALFKLGVSPDLIVQGIINNVRDSVLGSVSDTSTTRTNFFLLSKL